MASPSTSTGPLPKEEYTPEVAERHPVDPLSDDTVKHDDEEDEFDTRTIQEAPPPPAVSPPRLWAVRHHNDGQRMSPY